jgi:hypothetical protein
MRKFTGEWEELPLKRSTKGKNRNYIEGIL